MKKIYLSVLTLLLVFSLSGQVYLSQDFSGGTMPPAGWTIEGLQAQWSVSGSANAGGIAPEAKFTWTNGNTMTRLISNTIDLTGVSSVTLSFNHFYDWYANPAPIVGVATRSGGGDWNTVWEVTPTANIGPENKIMEINNANVGAADFQICFYLNGNMYNLDYWFLDEILIYIPYQTDAMLSSVNLPEYVATGAELPVTGAVKNVGANTINSFDVVYTVNGGEQVVYPVSGLTLTLGQVYSFTHPTPIVLTDPGSHEVVVTILNVNGGDDDYPENNTMTKYVGVVPFIPAKKVFCEEATGTWCGWCVRGVCFMEYMHETYPDTWIGVAVHNGDPMVYAPWDAAIPNIIPNFPGFPSGTIDRAGADYWDPSDFEAGYQSRINAISPATIDIINYVYNPETRVVDFDLSSEFIVDINSNLRFAAVIIEDSVWGTATGYNQANYYAGGGNGPMCGFESLPGTIPAAQMHYDHVGRVILDTPYGTEGSLPNPISAGSIQSYHYTYTIPDTWVYEKLQFVGLLINMSNGEILNANSVIGATVGIEEPKNDFAFNIYPNPVRSTANISFALEQPEVVNIEIYNLMGQKVYSTDNQSFGAGQNRIFINCSNLGEGVYFVKFNTPGQKLTRKISISK